MDMLDAHPAVASYDELLLAWASGNGYWGRTDLEFFEPYYARHRSHDSPLARARWAFRYLNKLYSPRQGTEAIGMKLMYEQLWKNPLVWLYMIRHRVRVVHIVRINLLDIVLSLETIKARRTPHALAGQVVETPTVTLDASTLARTLRTLEFRINAARRLLSLLPIEHLEIQYENLMRHPALLDDVFHFLGVRPPPTVASRFKKLNTAGKADLIDNYAEVEQILKDTRFERFLLD
jgi:hypothetical protein